MVKITGHNHCCRLLGFDLHRTASNLHLCFGLSGLFAWLIGFFFYYGGLFDKSSSRCSSGVFGDSIELGMVVYTLSDVADLVAYNVSGVAVLMVYHLSGVTVLMVYTLSGVAVLIAYNLSGVTGLMVYTLSGVVVFWLILCLVWLS